MGGNTESGRCKPRPVNKGRWKFLQPPPVALQGFCLLLPHCVFGHAAVFASVCVLLDDLHPRRGFDSFHGRRRWRGAWYRAGPGTTHASDRKERSSEDPHGAVHLKLGSRDANVETGMARDLQADSERISRPLQQAVLTAPDLRPPGARAGDLDAGSESAAAPHLMPEAWLRHDPHPARAGRGGSGPHFNCEAEFVEVRLGPGAFLLARLRHDSCPRASGTTLARVPPA
jgi:hypothetical protein